MYAMGNQHLQIDLWNKQHQRLSHSDYMMNSMVFFKAQVWGMHGQKGWDKSWKEDKAGVDLRNQWEYKPVCAPLCVGPIKRWA